MHILPREAWLPVMERAYKSLSEEYPVLVIGSQVIYLHTDHAFPSKDIGFLIPEYNPLHAAERVSQAVGLGEVRAEFFRRAENLITHIFVPLEEWLLTVEILSRTYLGPLFEGPLGDQLTLVRKGSLLFRTITLEAYIILQATRPDGPREVDIQRISRIHGHID